MPSDLAAAHAMILAARAARLDAEATIARERAANSSMDGLMARLKLEIEKLRRELSGTRSKRKAPLLGRPERQLEDLEADAAEDELAVEAAARSTIVAVFRRKRPVDACSQVAVERLDEGVAGRFREQSLVQTPTPRHFRK